MPEDQKARSAFIDIPSQITEVKGDLFEVLSKETKEKLRELISCYMHNEDKKEILRRNLAKRKRFNSQGAFLSIDPTQLGKAITSKDVRKMNL